MLPEQKRAAWALAVIGSSALTALGSRLLFGAAACWTVSLVGLLLASFLQGRSRKEGPGDERDVAIEHKADRLGFKAGFLAVCVAILVYRRFYIDTVPADSLLVVFGVGLSALLVARSIAVLVLYRQGAADAED